MVVWIHRPLRLRQRVPLQLLEHPLDGFLKLRVAPGAPGLGVELHLDVWPDPLVLLIEHPSPRVIKGRTCYAHGATAYQRRAITRRKTRSSGPLPDEGADARFPEIPCQGIACRTA